MGMGMRMARMLQVSSGMMREYHRDESDNNCRIPAGMDSLNAYLTSSSADASDSTLLAYWPSKDKVWIKLAQVARGLLNVPESSTSSERSFSLAGNTLADRHSRLSPELADGPMFLCGLK